MLNYKFGFAFDEGLDRNYCVLFDACFEKWSKKIATDHENTAASSQTSDDEMTGTRSLAEHVTRAWLDAHDELKQLCASIESGEIKLVYFDELQAKHFENKFGKLKSEIDYLCGYFKIPSRNKRIKQSMFLLTLSNIYYLSYFYTFVRILVVSPSLN